MKRILTAVIVLPFLIVSILFASLWWVFVLLAAAAMVMGLWEFYLLAKKLQLKPDPGAGYLAGAAIVTISLQNDPAVTVLLVQFVIIVLTAGTLIAATLRGAPFDKMIASVGATILGVLYIPLLGSHLISLRTGFNQLLSAHLLSFFFLVLMGGDTGAYYVGRAWWSCSSTRDGDARSLLVLSRTTAQIHPPARCIDDSGRNLWRPRRKRTQTWRRGEGRCQHSARTWRHTRSIG